MKEVEPKEVFCDYCNNTKCSSKSEARMCDHCIKAFRGVIKQMRSKPLWGM